MAQQWIRRVGTPAKGFRYLDPDGRPVRARSLLTRIDRLRVPPAWRDVHIANSSASAIQAWGFDARDRKQYRYHNRAVERRELRKYHRVRRLAKELPAVREHLRRDAGRRVLTRDAVAAIVLRLISETFCRVGGERYLRENGTYGITTVRKSHVTAGKGCISFEYQGKGSIIQRQFATTPELVRLVRRIQQTPGARLFRFRRSPGWADLTAHDVNEYLRRKIGGGFSAKDFRTWGGTLRAATVLAELGPPRTPNEAKKNVALAMRLVGAELGNTATVCRKSYVHPMVLARYVDEGDTIRTGRHRQRATGSPGAHSVEERSLIAFLDRHFPERRKRARE
jgi:DNA topoisomerase-1